MVAAADFNVPNEAALDGLAFLRALFGPNSLSVLNKGADKTAAVDSLGAFEDAIDEVWTAGGGAVHVPTGYYLLSNGFTLPQGVHLIMDPAAVLQLDHATANLITLGTDSSVVPTIIRGGILDAVVGNSGSAIRDPSGGGLRFWEIDRVAINVLGTNLQGMLLEQRGPSVIRVNRPRWRGGRIGGGDVVWQAAPLGVLDIEGGQLLAPSAAAWATSSGRLLASSDGAGSARNVHFDCRDVAAAGAIAFSLMSTAGALWRVKDSKFDFPAFSTAGMKWANNALLEEDGNWFSNKFFAYDPANPELDPRSRLGSLGVFSAAYGVVTSIVIPPGYRTVNLRCNHTTAPDLVMPEGWFAGQELLLTYYNASVSVVVPSFITTPVTGVTVPNISPGFTLSGIFVWEDRDASGTPSRWVQKGGWGHGSTLA
jgi:hypothetical protein